MQPTRRREKAKPIRLVTKRFVLRSLRPEDAKKPFLDWVADPEVMGPLNQEVDDNPRREVWAASIADCDGINRFQIGIFTRRTGDFIGVYYVTMDWENRNGLFSVMIGDKAYWGDKVVLETRAALLDHFFLQRGMEKAVGRPPARNIPSVFNYKAEGWRLEGVLKGQIRSIDDGSRLDQYEFGLLKEEWLELRESIVGDGGV
ncbi:MAG: GNAT family protein [Pseudomonadota bacterium]